LGSAVLAVVLQIRRTLSSSGSPGVVAALVVTVAPIGGSEKSGR